MTSSPDVVFIWDFDLTLTDEYQQVPLYARHFKALQAAGAREGVSFLKQAGSPPV